MKLRAPEGVPSNMVRKLEYPNPLMTVDENYARVSSVSASTPAGKQKPLRSELTFKMGEVRVMQSAK